MNIIGAAFITLSVFYAWLTQDLLPKISKEAVIVIDKASFHKQTDMLDAINEHKMCIGVFITIQSGSKSNRKEVGTS